MGFVKKRMRWTVVLMVLLPLVATGLVLSHGVTMGDSHAGDTDCMPCGIIDALSIALSVGIAATLIVPTITRAPANGTSTPRAMATYALLPQRAPPSC